MSDTQLLGAYADQGQEAAFREIVRRHTDLVYASAWRQLAATAAAADITQGVFVDLARKARTVRAQLTTESSLAGWLHRSTRYAVLNHLRDTRRRLTHERQAMEQLLTDAGPAASWEQIRPALDEALDHLDDADRAALLLRFFKNQDYRTVGAALGVSDDTAQKRVSRALETLRDHLARRGIRTTAAALTLALTANAMQATPAGLAATISIAALLTGTTASTAAILATTKTIAMTTLQKTLIAITVAALAGAGLYQARQAAQLRAQNQVLQQQLAGQIQALQSERDEATNRLAAWLADHRPGQLRKEHLELLSLRGRVSQLAGELRKTKTTTSPGAPHLSAQPDDTTPDSIIFTASSATNFVSSGNSLITGGWSVVDRRGYMLITPSIVPGETLPDERHITIQSRIIRAPESFWDEIGWGSFKSATRRSTISGELTAGQVALLLEALKATKDTEISSTPPVTIPDGERRGYGYSRQEDDGTGGALVGVDFYPRISADGHSVGIEIIPSPVTATTPLHPALQSN